ncbi:hypothetical protein GPJ56_002250 [Histomonas meleagridis]|uniref:uncharacterized protein n=1 Tax=Histomonas meleagridis TaxID=135588 RepID=UPI003559F5A5|nr:hypothetical protein GPJ56_002250 [Histomonas meleagridis]KAH0802942.1 hypothetical protein GO595_004449 [Histomonas meleagridis]
MPPSSQQEAQIFKDLLDSIVNESQFNKLNGRETVLIQSILIAIQKNPNFEEWENDLNVLMKQYPNEFRPFLIDILVQFEYDPQVFDLLAENYDIQEIAESFAKMKKPKVEIAFNFFVSLFSQGRHPILITHEIQSLLETLIRTNKHNKDCYILEDELEQINSPLELDELILTLEDILLNGLQWQEDFDLLLQYIDNSTDNIRLIQSSIDETFPEIITQSENKINIIKFIMELNKNCKEISFASCVEPILKCVDDDNLIIDCISQCMNNPNVMGVSINLIEKSTEKTMVLMEAVYKYLWGAPPQHLALLAKIIYNKFSKFLSNEDTNIRRLVQQIFVVFRRKIPKEFDRYLKKLTPTQQHIICFRAAKKIQ